MSHWTRRQVLQTAGAGVATLALAPLAALAKDEKPKGFTLPKLPYAYDALEPHIDAETMKIHHDKHHAAYVAGLNAALKGHPKLLATRLGVLLPGLDKLLPEGVNKQAVINMGGGHVNHTIFWQIMGPKAGGEPKGDLAKAIDSRFGSFDKFQKLLSDTAAKQFGSGWGWLILGKDGKLAVKGYPNQDSPYLKGDYPLVGVDVWEHAYYLKYKNKRPDYIAAWWKTVNWKNVADRYAEAKKAAG
jgi:Fe-Mn family superoxide dismutase